MSFCIRKAGRTINSNFGNKVIIILYFNILFRIENQYLHIILSSGVEALASLSMDQIQLRNGQKLNVFLKDPDWADRYTKRLEQLFEDVKTNVSTIFLQNWPSVNLNLDGLFFIIL